MLPPAILANLLAQEREREIQASLAVRDLLRGTVRPRRLGLRLIGDSGPQRPR